MTQVLSGLRVIELTMWIQGPVAARTLADMGAEVIKVEPPEGDPARGTRISFGIDTGLPNGMPLSFSVANQNKRSITLDLKQPAGVELLQKLIADADIFVTNLRNKALKSFGADPNTLFALNPRLIYAQGTGLGETGPWADRPAQDTIGMAHSGFLDTLSPDGATPHYVPGSLSDVISGTFLAMAVLGALRKLEQTGKGQHVTASQLQAMLWIQMMNVGVASNLGQKYPPFNRLTQFSPLFNLYKGGDNKWFSLNILQPKKHWGVLCEAIGHTELFDDERFNGIRSRSENRGLLIQILDDIFATKARDEWLEILGAAGLFVGKVNNVPDLLEDEQVKANNYLAAGEDGLLAPGAPFTLQGEERVLRKPTPDLGQDSSDVLADLLRLGEDEITELRVKGVIW